jgi:hypothetical protein
MQDGANGQADTPAGGQENAGSGKDGGNAGERETEYVTLADEGDEAAGGDASDESTEDEGEEEGEGEAESEGEQPRKRSGSQRSKAKIAALEREIASLRARQAQAAPASEDEGTDDAGAEELKEPKESDFPNDYLAFDRAHRAWQTRMAIREENRAKDAKAAQRRAERQHEARVDAYNGRLTEVKDRIPDFDKVMNAAGQMEVRDDVRDLLLESPKGPLLAYHLAKNPEKVAQLNRMSPASAAKEIGSLEARIRGPQPKTHTKAKPPKTPPKGGGAPPAKSNPDKMSNEEYRAWRAKAS